MIGIKIGTQQTTCDVLEVWIQGTSGDLKNVQHRDVGRQSSEQTRTESTEETPPPTVLEVQLPSTVRDVPETTLGFVGFVRLHRGLDDVRRIRQEPVEESGSPGSNPDHPCWGFVGICAMLNGIPILNQLVET